MMHRVSCDSHAPKRNIEEEDLIIAPTIDGHRRACSRRRERKLRSRRKARNLRCLVAKRTTRNARSIPRYGVRGISIRFLSRDGHYARTRTRYARAILFE